MKNKTEDILKKELTLKEGKMISRKEAIKKTVLITASAATMMILLGTPNKAHAASPEPPH